MAKRLSPRKARRGSRAAGSLVAAVLAMVASAVSASGQPAGSGQPEPSGGLEHPACWGDNHVGEELPPYVSGTECLFCHRSDIASTWPDNAHQRSVRQVDPDSQPVSEVLRSFVAAGQILDIQAVLGGDHILRFLKPNENDGQFSILSIAWQPDGAGGGAIVRTEEARWQNGLYGRRCAGCHSTAVESRRRTFAAPSLDCFSCHGDVDVGHSGDPSLVLLSRKRRDSARVVTSLCGQCHIRSGISASASQPYPNQFVAGDNLFRDLVVDFSDEALASANPIDRHVLENVRSVVVYGNEETTCLTCHSVHGESTKEHRNLRSAESCNTCHDRQGPLWLVKEYEVSSVVCEYGSEWEAEMERRRLEAEEVEAARALEAAEKLFKAFLVGETPQ